MKLRSDFVTNSSSSSFILARKGELSEQQKEAIVKYVEENMLGDIRLTPDSSEEEIADFFDEHDYMIDEDDQAEYRDMLKAGKVICHGYVSFDCGGGESLADLYQELWEILEKMDRDNFKIIDGDLAY